VGKRKETDKKIVKRNHGRKKRIRRNRNSKIHSQTKHTILLIQYTNNKKDKQYNDYPTVSGAMDGKVSLSRREDLISFSAICKLFEQKLRVEYPHKQELSYEIADLFKYVDSLSDLGALVYVVYEC
jgi:hypothetical protein